MNIFSPNTTKELVINLILPENPHIPEEEMQRLVSAIPFFIARDEDGYCLQLNRDTFGCSVWNDRPLRCRRYDCIVWPDKD